MNRDRKLIRGALREAEFGIGIEHQIESLASVNAVTSTDKPIEVTSACVGLKDTRLPRKLTWISVSTTFNLEGKYNGKSVRKRNCPIVGEANLQIKPSDATKRSFGLDER